MAKINCWRYHGMIVTCGMCKKPIAWGHELVPPISWDDVRSLGVFCDGCKPLAVVLTEAAGHTVWYPEREIQPAKMDISPLLGRLSASATPENARACLSAGELVALLGRIHTHR